MDVTQYYIILLYAAPLLCNLILHYTVIYLSSQ